MNEELREQIALFRFGVIAPLINRKGLGWGEREELLRHIISKQWQIPGTVRTSIGRATVRRWVSCHERGGIDGLKPRLRSDRGSTRCVDSETEQALLQLKQELPEASLPVLLKVARERKIIGYEFSVSLQSIYRMFQRHGVDKPDEPLIDRRRFEAEMANDLWQSDCMHGLRVMVEGRLRKSYLFAIIDDHSRLIPHAQFYLRENIDSFRDCLIQALQKRGLPRRLFVDNGAPFRSHRLKYACARLGIALLHTTPYSPESKGKVERIMRTIRMQFLPLLPQQLTLETLNRKLKAWVEEEYQKRKHSSTGQSPLERYLNQLALLRPAPKDLLDYFRIPVTRKVDKDRTVSLNGKLYEAPLGLVGKQVMLLYHEHDPQRIEVIYDERSWGFLVPLNLNANSRVKRINSRQTELKQAPESPKEPPSYSSGSLFQKRSSS
jgi:transposase InsO family protein